VLRVSVAALTSLIAPTTVPFSVVFRSVVLPIVALIPSTASLIFLSIPSVPVS